MIFLLSMAVIHLKKYLLENIECCYTCIQRQYKLQAILAQLNKKHPNVQTLCCFRTSRLFPAMLQSHQSFVIACISLSPPHRLPQLLQPQPTRLHCHANVHGLVQQWLFVSSSPASPASLRRHA